MDPAVFADLDSRFGPFDIDACADVGGQNAHCPQYWSEVDDCLQQKWAGKRVYCNPPFACIRPILRHFLQEWATDPYNTSATFVLPAWNTYPWWKLARHFTTVKTFPKGTSLFTSPDWRILQQDAGSTRRCNRGPTRWPVVIWHKAAQQKRQAPTSAHER